MDEIAVAELEGYRVALYRDPNSGEMRLDTRFPDSTNSVLTERTYELDDDAVLVEL